VAEPRSVYLALGTLCLCGSALVPGLGRVPVVIRATMAALALQAVLCVALFALDRRDSTPSVRLLRLAALLALAILAAVPGYFFGPNSGVGALFALALVLVGLLSSGGGPRLPAASGWLIYLALAASQAAVHGLIVGGVLPDHSLTRVMQAHHPAWHYWLGQLGLQGVFLAAFLAGRRFQKRYRRLALEVDQAVRVSARREALLEEARAEYKRALAVGLEGVFSGHNLGAYSLGHVLGRGGMGEVYAATHVKAGTQVAVKLLRGDRMADAAAVERFLQESEIAAQLASPHVARVFETGGLDQKVPFIAMERLQGEDLATLILGRGRLESAEQRRLVEDLASALEAIHAAGVVHLDVNPRNVMRTADGTWKLLDFGLAQLRAARAADSQPVGTLRYLAPERLRGSFADARADLYGLSACLYAATTGHDPFHDLPAAALPRAVIDRMPLAPRALADLPAQVEQVLLIGMAKLAVDRFDSASELRAAFGAALDGRLEQRWRDRADGIARVIPWSDAVSVPDPTTQVSPPAAALVAATASPDLVGDTRAEPPTLPPQAGAAPARDENAVTSNPASTYAWQDAYHGKMRGFSISVTALCLGGAVILRIIVVDPGALLFAWLCIAGIIAAVWLHERLSRRRPEAPPYWPWALVGMFSVGPTYALGFHSGFASIAAVLLFAGGLFRAGVRPSWIDRRGLVLASVCVAQGATFGLTLLGVLPDRGNAPVLEPGLSAHVSLIQHLLLQGVYVASFVAGLIIDRRFEALTVRAQTAVREAARQEALLATARAELDRALAGESGGIFSGLRVGRYQVGRLLGRGGMGEVYVATQADSGQRVALKLMRSDRVADPASLRRLLREAQALSRIDSPYVARVVDIGGIEEGLPYIAMEFIEGRSLASLLRQRDRLALDEVRALVRDVARGLQDVHRAGVVHRDLKPQNVVLAQAEGAAHWKIVDFGVAKLLDAASGTTQHLIVGTPQYMAPEQAMGERVDARSDLYSLCLLVYRALTGSPAQTAYAPGQAARVALLVGIPDPRSFVEVPADLALALRMGLAARPEDRFATALELATAFDEAFDGRLSPHLSGRARDLARREPWR